MTESQITLLAAIIGGGLGLIAAILSLITTLYGTVHQSRIDKCIRRIYPFVSFKIATLSAFKKAQNGMSYRFYRFFDKDKATGDDKFLFVQFKNLDNYKIMDLQTCFSFFQNDKTFGLGSLYTSKDVVVAFLLDDVIQQIIKNTNLCCNIKYCSEANEKLKLIINIRCDEQGRLLNDRIDILYWGKNYKNGRVVLDKLEISVYEKS